MTQQTDYESGFGPVQRRMERLRRGLRWLLKSLRRRQRLILIEIDWRLGDEIMAVEAVRYLRTVYPRDAIFVLTNYPEIYGMAGFPVILNSVPPRIDRYYLLRGAPRTAPRPQCNAGRVGSRVPLPTPKLALPEGVHPKMQALSKEGRVVVFAHETTWANKHWPARNWYELAERLEGESIQVVEIGVRDALELKHDFVGKTSVKDAAHILRDADLLVSVDCGLMHLALALGTPVVALFGPTDPDYLAPGHPLLHAVRNPLKCQGFWHRDVRVPREGICKCERETCTDKITAETVYTRVMQVLGEES